MWLHKVHCDAHISNALICFCLIFGASDASMAVIHAAEWVELGLGPWKILKCLESGPFWDQKWVKNGSKTRFSKIDPGPFGNLKQVFLARFEHVVTRFGPWKIPKCLEIGPFGEQKWVKNGSKTRFSKSDPGTLGMLKQVFLDRFQPVGTHFAPWKIPKCLENGPFWDQKWVKSPRPSPSSHSSPCAQNIGPTVAILVGRDVQKLGSGFVDWNCIVGQQSTGHQ